VRQFIAAFLFGVALTCRETSQAARYPSRKSGDESPHSKAAKAAGAKEKG